MACTLYAVLLKRQLMKSKVSVLIWIVTATIACCASAGLLSAKPAEAERASASLSVQPTTSPGGGMASVPASLNLSVTAPDSASWPEPLLYLLVGAALIGISVATKHVGRLRRKDQRMGKLSEISDLKILALAPPKQAGSSLEQGIRNHQGNRMARRG